MNNKEGFDLDGFNDNDMGDFSIKSTESGGEKSDTAGFDDTDFSGESVSQDATGDDGSSDSTEIDLPDFDNIRSKHSEEEKNGGTENEKPFSDDEYDSLPDFSNVKPSASADDEDNDNNVAFNTLYDKDTFDEDNPKKKGHLIPILVGCLCALVCIAAVLLFILFGRAKQPEDAVAEETPLEKVLKKPSEKIAEKKASKQKKEAVEESVEETVAEEDAVEAEEVAKSDGAREDEIVIVESPVVEPANPVEERSSGEVIKYKIKWGDTLWDISKTYYKNPWLYIVIADYNKLENPDLIIAGATLDIPPR